MIVFWLLIMESNGKLAQVMRLCISLDNCKRTNIMKDKIIIYTLFRLINKQKFIRTSKIKYFILNDLKNKNNKQLFI